jgi:hypothetical protein
MDPTAVVAAASAIAMASGLNVYATVLALGLMGRTSMIALPESLTLLEHPAVLGVAGVIYVVEFLADKVPGLDHLWDTLHTFIRIPAGAVLAAGAVGGTDPGWALAAGLLGGTLAAGTHATKASTRLLANATMPGANVGLSLAEDAVAVGALWAAFAHPIIALVLLALAILLAIWLLMRLGRFVRQLARRVAGLLRGRASSA